VIKSEELEITRNLAIELKIKYAEFEGQPRENGSGYFWKGLEMASTLDDRLYPQYTSDTMIELAKKFLEVEEKPILCPPPNAGSTSRLNELGSPKE
jgi:hypothetical protein